MKESSIVTYCALCAFKMGGGRADVMSLVEAKRRLSAVPFATHLRWRGRGPRTRRVPERCACVMGMRMNCARALACACRNPMPADN